MQRAIALNPGAESHADDDVLAKLKEPMRQQEEHDAKLAHRYEMAEHFKRNMNIPEKHAFPDEDVELQRAMLAYFKSKGSRTLFLQMLNAAVIVTALDAINDSKKCPSQ